MPGRSVEAAQAVHQKNALIARSFCGSLKALRLNRVLIPPARENVGVVGVQFVEGRGATGSTVICPRGGVVSVVPDHFLQPCAQGLPAVQYSRRRSSEAPASFAQRSRMKMHSRCSQSADQSGAT